MDITIKLTKATLDDAEFLFNLRNDEFTRQFSLNQEPVAWSTHLEWLTKSLNNNDRALYVAVDPKDDQRCGQVRFDKLNEQEAEISISVASTYRGKGLGTIVINEGINLINREWSPKRIIAIIQPHNQASKKIFQKSHFRYVRNEVTKNQITVEVWEFNLP